MDVEQQNLPSRLYKYLPSKFTGYLQSGHLLMRNLVSFVKYEDGGVRGDVHEGLHVDWPDHDVTISSLANNSTITGSFGAVRDTHQDKVYIFCLSTDLKLELFEEFQADSCIEISNVEEFLCRYKRAIDKSPRFRNYPSKLGLYGKVEYYDFNSTVDLDISNAWNLPFFKKSNYSYQSEFRLCAAEPGAFKEEMMLVTSQFEFEEIAKKKKPENFTLKIGSIRNISTVIRKDEV